MIFWQCPLEYTEDEYKQSIHGVIGMLQSGALRPNIGTTFPLEQASQGFEASKGMGNGKLVYH